MRLVRSCIVPSFRVVSMGTFQGDATHRALRPAIDLHRVGLVRSVAAGAGIWSAQFSCPNQSADRTETTAALTQATWSVTNSTVAEQTEASVSVGHLHIGPKVLLEPNQRYGKISRMSSVEEIESAVRNLSGEEYGRFREWLIEYDNQLWDRQMKEDAEAGRLDDLASEALNDLRSGRTRNL